ncbi:very short patch repair endonuclease [Candidatus Electronema sp. JC]|uniref:very short patch repair endonuclease n=1 Tax=Candidatus Electronema sp. JC TaxID=3401570 RepID=UPI003AA90D8C
MTDTLPPERRSWNMSRIRSQHTKPELIIRSLLHRAGFRFRISNKTLPGSPDVVLPKYKTAIFVHGCFWHRHENCAKARMPGSNQDYWRQKFARNRARDAAAVKELESQCWRVIVLWECDILRDPLAMLERLVHELKGGCAPRQYAADLERGQVLRLAEKKRAAYMKNRAGKPDSEQGELP